MPASTVIAISSLQFGQAAPKTASSIFGLTQASTPENMFGTHKGTSTTSAAGGLFVGTSAATAPSFGGQSLQI